MCEIAWTRELFERWPKSLPSGRDQTAFANVLRSVDIHSLEVNAEVLERAISAGGLGADALRRWAAWNDFPKAPPKRGLTEFRLVARAFPQLPEAWILLGAAGLIAGQRGIGWHAWQKALQLEPRYRVLADLLAKFGIRRAPVLRFLPRNHPLDKALGRLRSRFGAG